MKITTKQPNKIRRFQRDLYKAAKISLERRFAMLYDKVYREDVLQAAWVRVRTGGKAAGVDKMTINHIKNEIGVENFLKELREELMSQTYSPLPVRRVHILKSAGKTRPLGIPAVRDKVAQMAVKLIIEPLFERDFRDCSYGFRPKRSNQQAAQKVHSISNHNKWIVDVDLKSYFDTIDHSCLMGLLRKRISDKRVLHLIRQWLRNGILERDGSTTQTGCGTPQGGVLSPLLSNIYLHSIDKLWCNNTTVKLIRFADDMGFIYKEAYSFSKKRRVRIKFPQPERVVKFQRKLKEHFKTIKLGTPLKDVVEKTNMKLRAWTQYYKIGNSYKVAERIAGYVCTQLRLYWRRCKHRKDIRGTRKWKDSFFYTRNLLYLPKLINPNRRCTNATL